MPRSSKSDQPGRLASISSGVLAALRPSAVSRALGVAAAVALVGGLAFGISPLKSRVAEMRTDPLVVEIVWPGATGERVDASETWLPGAERARLEQIAAATLSPDPFNVESLRSTRDTLLSTGWFASVDRVQRRPGGVVEVDAQWRLPAAVVRRSGIDYLVAWGGELLPIEYSEGASWPLRFIRGVWAGPPPRSTGGLDFGAHWQGGDVQAALDLLRLVRGSAAWDRIAGVDASGFVRSNRLTLVTTGGAELVWGAPPGAQAPGEQPDAQKLARLVAVLDDPAWIGAGRPRVQLFPPVTLIDETAR